MKPREQRKKVMLSARMRSTASWHDACILNMSSGGLMLQTAAPPERGSYLEVRRGPHIIVARVVWTQKHRVGLQAQDLLPIEAIVTEQAAAALVGGTRVIERRRAPRSSHDAAERARQNGQLAQGIALGLAGIVAAFLLLAGLQQTLSNSMARISAALWVAER